MTTLNVNKIIDEAFTTLEETLSGIVNAIKSPTEEPVKENTTPEAPADEPSDEDFDYGNDEEFAFLVIGDGISPAWEAVEALREAEVAADENDHEKANSYIAIADRYIKLADIFKTTEVTVSL